MPNHVTNIILIKGNKERVEEILKTISYDDPNTELSTFDFMKVVPEPEVITKSSHDSDMRVKIETYLSYTNPKNTNPILERKRIFSRTDIPYDCFTEDDFQVIIDILKTETSYCFDFSPSLNTSLTINENTELSYIREGKEYIDNILNYGNSNWYDWRLKNWGTKWNSYDYQDFEKKDVSEKILEMGDNNTAIVRFHTAWSPSIYVTDRLAEMFPDVEIKHLYADEDTGYNCGFVSWKDGKFSYDKRFEKNTKEAYEFTFMIDNETPEESGYAFSEEKGTYEFIGFDD